MSPGFKLKKIQYQSQIRHTIIAEEQRESDMFQNNNRESRFNDEELEECLT